MKKNIQLRCSKALYYYKLALFFPFLPSGSIKRMRVLLPSLTQKTQLAARSKGRSAAEGRGKARAGDPATKILLHPTAVGPGSPSCPTALGPGAGKSLSPRQLPVRCPEPPAAVAITGRSSAHCALTGCGHAVATRTDTQTDIHPAGEFCIINPQPQNRA